MKKTLKMVLLIVAALTVILLIAAAVMLKAVTGDALFYMDSWLGNIYAVSYRWVCLASAVLILFWVILGVKNRSKFTGLFKKKERKLKEVAHDIKTSDKLLKSEMK